MRRYSYLHLDVFTDRPFGGNPLSVFLDGTGLSTAEMQAIAKEMNHSESTFLFPAERGGVAKMRIFTPTVELPFAGHPVIGTAFALALENPIGGEVSIELGDGMISTRIEREDVSATETSSPAERGRPGAPSFVWMSQRPPENGVMLTDVDRLARTLGVGRGDIDGAAEVWSTGIPFLYVPLNGLTPMGRIRVNAQILPDLLLETGARGIYAVTRETLSLKASVRARCFPTGVGVAEDAATGSAAGGLAGFALGRGWAQPGRFEVEQGVELGRPSRIVVEVDAAGRSVRVGGRSVSMGRGELTL